MRADTKLYKVFGLKQHGARLLILPCVLRCAVLALNRMDGIMGNQTLGHKMYNSVSSANMVHLNKVVTPSHTVSFTVLMREQTLSEAIFLYSWL